MFSDPELGLYNGATVRLRVDEQTAFNTTTVISTDKEALFFQGASIIGQMGRGDSLLFGFTPFNSNPAETEFKVSGLDVAMQTFEGHCSIP